MRASHDRPGPVTAMRWLFVAALGVIATSCTADDDTPMADSTAPADTTVAPVSTAATKATMATMAAEPSTTTTIPPPVVDTVALDLAEDLGSAGAVDLLAAQSGRGHLLIGYEQAERAPTQPRIWESPDGLAWVTASAPTPPDGTTLLTVTGGTWFGDVLAVGGSTATAGVGPRATVWLATDGAGFESAPELSAGDVTSGVSAVAATDAGLVAVGWVDDDVDRTFVAVRRADGAWTPATVPDLPDFDAVGVAAVGATIVVTGSDRAVDPAQARALVSTDAGATFQLADTSSLAGGVDTALGPVEVVPSGFVAVACAPTATGTVTALARSADGVAWARQDIRIIGDDDAMANLRLDGGGCSSLSVQGDVALVGVLDLNAWTLAVVPTGEALAQRTIRRLGTIPAAGPLVQPLETGLLVVGIDPGGFTPSVTTPLMGGQGLPAQRPYVSGLDVISLADEIAVRVELYPDVNESRSGYSWSEYNQWFVSGDGRTFAPSGQISVDMKGAVATSFGDFGLGINFNDPADEGNGGPVGGTEGLVRNTDGTWRSLRLIAAGPGGERLSDAVAFGSGAIAIGVRLFRDPESNVQTSTPLVSASGDGTTWIEEAVPLPDGAEGGLTSVCTLGDRALAYGWQTAAGVESALAAVRDPSGVWTVVAPSGIPATTTLGSCAADAARVVIVGAGSDRSTVYASTDGVNFTAAELSDDEFADTTFSQIVAFGGGFVAVGDRLAPDRDRNGAVWTSPDGLAWSKVVVDGLDGLGSQSAAGVAVAPDASLTVAGYDNGAPVIWSIPADALA